MSVTLRHDGNVEEEQQRWDDITFPSTPIGSLAVLTGTDDPKSSCAGNFAAVDLLWQPDS